MDRWKAPTQNRTVEGTQSVEGTRRWKVEIGRWEVEFMWVKGSDSNPRYAAHTDTKT